MDARREARRRRILENADSRLQRVMEIQSKARKKTDDKDTSEKDDGDHLELSSAGFKSKDEEHVDATDKIAPEIDGNTSAMGAGEDETPMDNREICGAEQRASSTHTDDESKEGTCSEPDAKVLKYIEQRQMVYRMLFIFGLALLLTIVSNLKSFENTRYGNVRDSSFLPYFITLEVIILCLFPVKRELKKSSLIHLVLAIFGFNETKIIISNMVLSLTTRLFQDLVWFVFTVTMLNYYISSS